MTALGVPSVDSVDLRATGLPQPQRGDLTTKARGNAQGTGHHQPPAPQGRTKTPPTDPNWQTTQYRNVETEKDRHAAVLNSNSVLPSLAVCLSRARTLIHNGNEVRGTGLMGAWTQKEE